jgi:alpha-amylase/alpha-mannosidase (GH57 family)
VPGPRAIVIHGHFYQPPRENPWLEAVEVQDSAAPHHDWNVRVTEQCYAPNTAARRVDGANRVTDIVNNFERISFNVGPTLHGWLARHRPDVSAAILDADRASRQTRGHGNALAQVFNHMILPLATRRDKVTQVRWGLEDFRRRFGREPEGMWLPETAVDGESLEVLAEAGLRFTILAPHQAHRVRPPGGDWLEVGEGVDPRRPYRWRGPRDLSLALFFYDGPISRDVAFGNLLERGEHLADRLRAGFAEDDGPQLVHCATDGESYGHHRLFGDMALAAATERLDADPAVTLTNYAAFLAAHPPAWEADIREATSWSCAHGVERWRADCGCRTRADWHQRWRAPLREALDWLRDQADAFYEARASAYLKDPWAARDGYAEVLFDRSPERLEAFLAAHQRAPLDAAARVDVRRLLELQKNRLLMYTSCGWFFDEISALEPVQVLRYAAMALQHLVALGGERLESAFVQRLAAAPSNVAELGDGARVYRRLIVPAVVDLPRVVAHHAITGLFDDHAEATECYAWCVERRDEARATLQGTALRLERVRVTSAVTGETAEAACAVLHLGGHDISCKVRMPVEDAAWGRARDDLLDRFARQGLPDLVRALDGHFPGTPFGLPHLFLEERRRVLAAVVRSTLDRHEETYRRIWDENRKLVHYLREVDAPVPDALALVARHVLEQEALAALAEVPALGKLPARVFELAEEARGLGLTLDLVPARPAMREAVYAALARVAEAPEPEGLARADALLEGAERLGLRYGRWEAQNRFFRLWRARPDAHAALAPLASRLGFHLSS